MSFENYRDVVGTGHNIYIYYYVHVHHSCPRRFIVMHRRHPCRRHHVVILSLMRCNPCHFAVTIFIISNSAVSWSWLWYHNGVTDATHHIVVLITLPSARAPHPHGTQRDGVCGAAYPF